MAPNKLQISINELTAKVEKLLEKDGALNPETMELLHRLDHAVFGTEETLGITARLTMVERWMKSISNAGKVIAGVLTTAVMLQLLNILISHWK